MIVAVDADELRVSAMSSRRTPPISANVGVIFRRSSNEAATVSRRLVLRHQLYIAVVAVVRIDHGDRVLREAAEVLLEDDVVVSVRASWAAKRFSMPNTCETKRSIADVSDDFLVMRDEEAIAVDRLGVGIERVGLAVQPAALRAVGIGLILERDAVHGRPLETAAQPELRGAGEVVEHVVIGREGPRVDRHRAQKVVVERVRERGAGDDPAGCIGTGERGRHHRRAPIGVPGVLDVIDGEERLEVARHPIIEPRREIGEILVIAVDEAVDPVLAHVEAIIETCERCASARTEPGTDRTEAVHRGERLVLDGPGRRRLVHVVDRAADRAHLRT